MLEQFPLPAAQPQEQPMLEQFPLLAAQPQEQPMLEQFDLLEQQFPFMEQYHGQQFGVLGEDDSFLFGTAPPLSSFHFGLEAQMEIGAF